jgi:hypothetical protein
MRRKDDRLLLNLRKQLQNVDFVNLSKRALQAECKKRGLFEKGTKAELICRLEKYEDNKDKSLDVFAHPEFVEMFWFTKDCPGLLLVAHHEAFKGS